MKTELFDGKIMVIPETDLEADLLYSIYTQGVSHTAFVKTGMSLGDRLGVLINPSKEKPLPVDEEPAYESRCIHGNTHDCHTCSTTWCQDG